MDPPKFKLQLGRHREATEGGYIAKPTLQRTISEPAKTWPAANNSMLGREREIGIASLLNILVIASCTADNETEKDEAGLDADGDHAEVFGLPVGLNRKGRRIKERERRAKSLTESNKSDTL
jgi:hypothetical protein